MPENLRTICSHEDHLSRWEIELLKVCNRMETAYNKCGFFDSSLPFGGPRTNERRRRAINERYDENDGIASIEGITGGMKNFSLRYLAECSAQAKKKHFVNHSRRWRQKLTENFAHC